MSKTIVKFGSVEEFFKRGRKIARLADKGEPIPCERIISFEETDVRVIMANKKIDVLESAELSHSMSDKSVSSFDDFLADDGLLDDAIKTANERVYKWALSEASKYFEGEEPDIGTPESLRFDSLVTFIEKYDAVN